MTKKNQSRSGRRYAQRLRLELLRAYEISMDELRRRLRRDKCSITCCYSRS
ncbi:MAG: hypothetical protein ABIK86_03665 [candidate division WOR-3 bacterium]